MSRPTSTTTKMPALGIAIWHQPSDGTYLAEVRFDPEDQHLATLRTTVERLIEQGAFLPADRPTTAGDILAGRVAFKLGWLREMQPTHEADNPHFMRGCIAGYLSAAVAETQLA